MSEKRNAMHLDYEARVRAHREASGVDIGMNSHDPRTVQEISLDKRIDQEADTVSPKWEKQLEMPEGDFYSTDGRWGPTHQSLCETSEERTARLSGVSSLGSPPGYGNFHPLDALRNGMGPNMTQMSGEVPVAPLPMQEVIARAVHNSPPPLDDVGGLDMTDFDEFDPDKPSSDLEDPFFDPDLYEPLPIYEPDPVNSPSHYMGKGFEVIDVIEAFGLTYHLGNVIKYVLRAGRKGERTQDLKKALWYLKRELGL